MKKAVITQSNYIPWKGYFDAIRTADVFVLYDDVQYTRRDWRNRNKIKTPQGPQWLTIPVEVKGKYFQKISETRIADLSWADEHWKTIAQNYAKAPCYAEYKDFFEELYRTCRYEYLSEVNRHFLEAIARRLGFNTPFHFSSEFELEGDKSERLLNLCTQLGATQYYSGPAAKAYMNEEIFTAKGVSVHYFDYSGYPEYPQLFPPFDHAVSIVDLLMNTGPQALQYMKQNPVEGQ